MSAALLTWPSSFSGAASMVLRACLTVVMVAYGGLLAAALASMAGWSAQEGWPALLREMLHLLALPVVPLLVAACALRAWMLARVFLGVLLLVGWLVGAGPMLAGLLPTASSAQAAAAGPQVRVLSLNTGAAQRLADPESIVRTVLATSPDVICLVEAHGDTLATVGRRLIDTYPYQMGSGELFVISRFPLADPRRGVLQNGAKDSLHLTLEIEHRLVGLTVVHLQRPDTLPGLRAGPRALIASGRQFTTAPRDDAVSQLAAYLRAEGGPQIVAGDFNMTPTSAAHRALTARLRDAFQEGGWGLGHSYPIGPSHGLGRLGVPLLRIDYIFHTPDLVTVRARTGPASGSDHLPILADLAFR